MSIADVSLLGYSLIGDSMPVVSIDILYVLGFPYHA
jgi:hypothetical protein